MKPEIYDLFWASGKQQWWEFRAELGKKNWNTADLSYGFPAAILYPALVTPDVVVRDAATPQKLELLLLVQPQLVEAAVRTAKAERKLDFLRVVINRQLKITKGLSTRRPYEPGKCLFDATKLSGKKKGRRKLIGLKLLSESLKEGEIYETVERFRGIVDKRMVEFYKSRGFKEVWRVSIAAEVLDKALDVKNLPPGVAYATVAIRGTGWLKPCPCDRLPGRRNPDYQIYEAVGNDSKPMNGGRYGPEYGGHDMIVKKLDPGNPVQAFHPVFVYKTKDGLDKLKIGHMADIHLSSRQQWLAKSTARVIEHPDEPCKTVGEMLNICSKNVVELFKGFAGPTHDVHMVVISGDLVDHNRNVTTTDSYYDDGFPTRIWDLVKLKEKLKPTPGRKDKTGGWHLEDYPENVDFLSLYSLFVKFYEGKLGVPPKPVFAVAGNHDDYEYPFGIYPLLVSSQKGRTNTGIPADHNLTIYEACLAFGETYHALLKWTNNSADKFTWFYEVFTPFSDFALELPKQYLVGLAWGDDERLKEIFSPSGEQGRGFLPRANKAVSGEQKALLEEVLTRGGGRPVILASHFTFASYREEISEASARRAQGGHSRPLPRPPHVKDRPAIDEGREPPDIRLDGKYTLADMGTFEKERKWLYGLLGTAPKGKGKVKISSVLTGHSHRRGLYFLSRKGDSVKPAYYVFGPDGMAVPDKRKAQTAIIVSDSGGSIPRRNMFGEFNGWGSDKPSGTKVVFDDQGLVKEVGAVQVGIVANKDGKPRFAVALDYEDIIGKYRVMAGCQSDPITKDTDLDEVRFHLTMGEKWWNYSVVPSEMSLYALEHRSTDAWCRIEMKRKGSSPHGTKSLWKIKAISGGDREWQKTLRAFSKPKDRDRVFMSVKFDPLGDSPLRDHYDFESPWTFEIKLKKERVTTRLKTWGKVKYKYVIERDKIHCTFPDFKRRKQYYDGLGVL